MATEEEKGFEAPNGLWAFGEDVLHSFHCTFWHSTYSTATLTFEEDKNSIGIAEENVS